MMTWDQIAQKIVRFTAATTTAGTTFTVAHNLGYPPAIDAVRVQATADAAATDNANIFAVVSTDGTNITLKPGRTIGTPTTGTIYIGLAVNGAFNAAR